MSLITAVRRFQKKKRRIYEYYIVNPKAAEIYESLKLSRGISNTFYSEVIEYILPFQKVHYSMLHRKYKLSSKRILDILSLLEQDQIIIRDHSVLEDLLA